MGKLFEELKRRKFNRVATVYAVVAWLLIQNSNLIPSAVFQGNGLPYRFRRKSRFFIAALAVLTFSSGVNGAVVDCEPDGELQFLCGPVNPEDMAPIPNSKWVIVSSMINEGALYLADTLGHTFQILFPSAVSQSRHDIATYSECPGPLSGNAFRPHGLYLKPGESGLHTLYVVGHGAREAVEIFEINAQTGVPSVTWIGCVTPPDSRQFNAVVALPEGGFAATSPGRGSILEWSTDTGWNSVLGTEDWKPFRDRFDESSESIVAPNGIEISPDGQWFYVGTWFPQGVVRLSRGRTPVTVEEISVGFHVDNVRQGPNNTLFAAGQSFRTGVSFGVCLGSQQCDGVYSHVAKIDTDTLSVDEVVRYPSNEFIILGTSAIQVGSEIWFSGVGGGNRIALFHTQGQ